MDETSGKRRGTSIRIFLPDCVPEGLRIVEKSNWTGRATMCSRAQYASVKVDRERWVHANCSTTEVIEILSSGTAALFLSPHSTTAALVRHSLDLRALLRPSMTTSANPVEVLATLNFGATSVEVNTDRRTRAALRAASAEVGEERQARDVDRHGSAP